MRNVKKVIAWILTAFILLSALVYFPSVASILMALFAAFSIPLDPVKQFWDAHKITGLIRGGLMVLLFVAVLVVLPESKDDTPGADAPTASPLAASAAVSPTTVPDPTQTPEASNTPAPTQTPTPTPEPTPTPSPTPAPEPQAWDYVLNTNTMKFHWPSCSSVSDIQPHNRQDYTGTRDDLIALGYSPCGRCKP